MNEDKSWCCFSGVYDYEYNTMEEAFADAKTRLDVYRSDASNSIDGWSEDAATLRVYLDTHTIKITDNPPDEDEPGSDPTCEYELQPTPEWQRIQEQLSKVEQLEKEHAELKAKTPHTADGVAIGIGDTVWFQNPDWCSFGVQRFICEKVEAITGRSFKEYNGEFTLTCECYEHGNLDCYSTLESCQSAQTEGEGA